MTVTIKSPIGRCVLACLEEWGELETRQISDELGLDYSTVAHALHHLALVNYVERIPGYPATWRMR